VFNLRIDDDTMRLRLGARADNDWPLGPEGVELMLALNRSDEGPAGAIDIDATRPLSQVVDEVLRLANCSATNHAQPVPWARRGSATFVLREDRQEVARIDYSWSGDVLRALLTYLAEQGIDLKHSVTSDDRERYLARLDPSAFDGETLRRYYEELNGVQAAGVGYAMLDGVALLRDSLAPLRPGIVGLIVIG
jgi:hypothetical protein